MEVSENPEVNDLGGRSFASSANQLHWEALTLEVALLLFHHFHVTLGSPPCLSKPPPPHSVKWWY